MAFRRFALGLVFAAVSGCSDDGDTPDGSGGSSSTASSSASGSVSTSTSTSGSSTTSTSGSGTSSSSSGSGGGCPDISCALDCPSGLWADLEGCPTCTCAPPEVQLWVHGVQKNPAHLAMTTVGSKFVGGIDRWVFDFTWHYDDPMTSDDEEIVTATVRVQDLPMYEITEANVSWFSPNDDGAPLEVMGGTYTLYGIAVINDTLTPVAGFLSIRRVADTFEGGVFLFMEGAGPAGSVDAGGPFSVPVP